MENEEFRQKDGLNACKTIGTEPVHVRFHSRTVHCSCKCGLELILIRMPGC